MKSIILTAFLIGITFIGSNGFAQEHHHGHGNSEKMQSMVKIMQGMNVNIHKLTTAIMLEDYPLITSSAHDIANHPGIDKKDLYMLFERLGSLKKGFISCDTAVHNFAKDVSMAGKQQDMELVLEKYSAMISKAVECHRKYKIKD